MTISSEDLVALLKDSEHDSLAIIDARPYSVYALGHIGPAINIRLSCIMLRRLAQVRLSHPPQCPLLPDIDLTRVCACSQGKLTVEDLLSDSQRHVLARLPPSAPVIVYDDKPYPGAETDTKHTLLTALRNAGKKALQLIGLSCAVVCMNGVPF